LVWLQLIPLVGQIWQFFVIVKIAGSIRNEMIHRYDDELFGDDAAKLKLGNKRPTLVIGLAYSILMCLAYPLARYQAAENARAYAREGLDMTRTTSDTYMGSVILGSLGLAMIACWIAYWIILAIWKRRLKNEVQLAA